MRCAGWHFAKLRVYMIDPIIVLQTLQNRDCLHCVLCLSRNIQHKKEVAGNWEVCTTRHSPAFDNLYRDSMF